MPNEDDITGWIITPEDDGFHDDYPELSDHPYWMETFWTSFNHPERKMGGWFYNQMLRNQGEHGICNGGAWVWDDSDEPALYQVSQQALPMPPGGDLHDIQLPNGNRIKVKKPLMTYEMQYVDKGKYEADLVFDGVMEPNPHPAGVFPFWKGRHFDQAMHVTGEIVLHGERIEIDCLSVRDRSWSPRPPPNRPRERSPGEPARPPRPTRPPFTLGYIFGTASPNDAFLAYTMLVEGEDTEEVKTGYLVRDGKWAHLVSGWRTCLVDRDKGWIFRIEFEGTDTLGRTIHAVGDQVSNHGQGTGLFSWSWDGSEGWGENQGGMSAAYPRVERPS